VNEVDLPQLTNRVVFGEHVSERQALIQRQTFSTLESVASRLPGSNERPRSKFIVDIWALMDVQMKEHIRQFEIHAMMSALLGSGGMFADLHAYRLGSLLPKACAVLAGILEVEG